jgi:hypothetical protein
MQAAEGLHYVHWPFPPQTFSYFLMIMGNGTDNLEVNDILSVRDNFAVVFSSKVCEKDIT